MYNIVFMDFAILLLCAKLRSHASLSTSRNMLATNENATSKHFHAYVAEAIQSK